MTDAKTTDRLKPFGRLEPKKGNDRLVSENGFYEFVLQGDGNAVIYAGGLALFATGTAGKTPGDLFYQEDGNVVLYDHQGHPVWATGTPSRGKDGSLIMQNDGNLVLYNVDNQAVWASNTVQEVVTIDGPLENFVFDLDNAKKAPPVVVKSHAQNLRNETATPQHGQVEMAFTFTETDMFSAAFGITVGASVKAEVGIPLLANGEVTVSAEISTTLTWGKESSTSFSQTATGTAEVPAKSTMKVLQFVTQTPITVPFVCTASYTLRDLGTGKEIHPRLPYHGTYSGQHDFSSQINFYAAVPIEEGKGFAAR